jgi:ABC-type lipoprotein export system ATPase subunit
VAEPTRPAGTAPDPVLAGVNATPAGTEAAPAGVNATPAGTDGASAEVNATPAGTDATPAGADAPPLVQLEGISRRYGTVAPVVALRSVDLEVRAGEWVAIVGASGSGKTSLLNIVGCLDRQTSGTYRFDGVDVSALSDRRRAGLRSRRIGFIFQSFHLLSYRTVLENVMLSEAYGRRPRAGRADRARAALTAVGLADRVGFLPTRLSGGERQRVAIARALIRGPQLLLCDEPTGNLDSVTTASILELLAGLHEQGLTLFVITHERDVAARAQRQVRIVDGQLRGER